LQRVKEAAEQAKIELSSSKVAEIQLPFLTADQTSTHHLKARIDRVTFEALIMDLVHRTIDICTITLKDADRVVAEIDEVIPIGGSTRIPLVEQSVASYFGRHLYMGPRREDAVALGAAILSGVLERDVKNVLLLDVIPFSLGIETTGGVFSRIINRNETIPTTKSMVFSTSEDNQSAVSILVLQGEQEMAAENKLLGQFDLDGIPPAP
jgi:molecular chaperone DnaK